MNQVEKPQDLDLLQKQIAFIYDPSTGKVKLTKRAGEGFRQDLRYLRLRATDIDSIARVRELKAVIDDQAIQDMFLPFGEYDSAKAFQP